MLKKASRYLLVAIIAVAIVLLIRLVLPSAVVAWCDGAAINLIDVVIVTCGIMLMPRAWTFIKKFCRAVRLHRRWKREREEREQFQLIFDAVCEYLWRQNRNERVCSRSTLF